MGIKRTNILLGEVLGNVATLITWADADADASMENDARAQAKEDRARARRLRRAAVLLQQCERDP